MNGGGESASNKSLQWKRFKEVEEGQDGMWVTALTSCIVTQQWSGEIDVKVKAKSGRDRPEGNIKKTNLNSTKLVEGEVGLVVAKLEAPVPDAVLLAHLPG